MYEKNIVGTYKISQEYPVFSYEDDHKTPSVPAVAPAHSSTPVLAVHGAASLADPIAQWRSFSEQLRNRRLARQAVSDGQKQPSQGHVSAPQQQGNSIDQQYQKAYEMDKLNLSSGGTSDPLYMNLQRYLSMVNHPISDEDKKTYIIEDPEDHPHPGGPLRVADVMTRRVVCVLESTSIEQVASICNRKGISGVPVVNAQRSLVGIVTLTDIINHLFEQKAITTYAHTDGEVLEQQALAILDEPVRNYMRREVITVHPSTTVKEACRLMLEKRIRRVVVTQGDLVKGIFSAQDAVRVLAEADLNLA